MTNGMAAGMAGMGIAVWLLGIVIVILWIALPFAVFGIKKRLDAIIVELRRLNNSGSR